MSAHALVLPLPGAPVTMTFVFFGTGASLLHQ